MLNWKKLRVVDVLVIDPRTFEVVDSNAVFERGQKCYETLGFFSPCSEYGYPCPVTDPDLEHFDIRSDSFHVRVDVQRVGGRIFEVRARENYYVYYRRVERTLREGLTDVLTGLPNKRGLERYVRTRLRKALSLGSRAWYVFIDLQHLKEVNDRFGHEAGDRMIKEFGLYLRDNLKTADFVARISGDEFAVILVDVSKEDVCRILRRLEESVPVLKFGKVSYKLEFSYGVASIDGGDIETAHRKADFRMYRNKMEKKFLELFDSMSYPE